MKHWKDFPRQLILEQPVCCPEILRPAFVVINTILRKVVDIKCQTDLQKET
jgi:hypothetical protein